MLIPAELPFRDRNQEANREGVPPLCSHPPKNCDSVERKRLRTVC